MNLLSSLLNYTARQIAALRAKDTSQDTEISGAKGRLTTAESNISTLTSRIETAISAVTTSTEVTDIRVGDDGVTYGTAGTAVRTQFSNLKSEINHLWVSSDNLYDPNNVLANTNINSSGVEDENSNFETTNYYIELPFTGDNYFYINSENVGSAYEDYKGIMFVARYDENKNFLARASMATQSYFGVSTTNGAKYVRFVVGKNTENLMLVVRNTFDASYNPAYIPFGGKVSDTFDAQVGKDFDKITDNDFAVPLKHILKTGGMTSIFRTAGVVGDSLASGCMEYKENGTSYGYDRYEFSWLQQMKHICGFDTAYNFSAGGLTSKKFWTSTNSHITDLREDGANHKCQLYFIALGVNDIADTSIDVGTSDDISDTSSTTFYGYYSRIISLIQSIQPRAKIFLVGLPNHSNMTVWGARFTSFKNAIADMVNYFDNCYYLDLFTYDVPYDATFQQTYFNGFHENALGYLRSAWVISSYVDWYIRHNYEEFREVGFIGTDLHYYSE